MVYLLPRPQPHEEVRALVLGLSPTPRVRVIAEGREFSTTVTAGTEAEGEPPAAQPVNVTVSRASFPIRRRGNGVTIVPIRSDEVREAIALSTTHGSAMSQEPGTGLSTWSQTKKPSNPAVSAASASSTAARGSASSPKSGRLIACSTGRE